MYTSILPLFPVSLVVVLSLFSLLPLLLAMQASHSIISCALEGMPLCFCFHLLFSRLLCMSGERSKMTDSFLMPTICYDTLSSLPQIPSSRGQWAAKTETGWEWEEKKKELSKSRGQDKDSY